MARIVPPIIKRAPNPNITSKAFKVTFDRKFLNKSPEKSSMKPGRNKESIHISTLFSLKSILMENILINYYLYILPHD